MKFGLSLQDWATVENLAVAPLKKFGARVFVFGSRARGQHRKFSDIDLLYETQQKVPLWQIGAIKDSLDQSNLPIKVDIVDRDDLAESYKSSALAERIEV